MNTRTWITAVAALGAIAMGGLSHAQSSMPNGEIPETINDTGTSLSRAEVRAELNAARAQGITGTDVDTIDGGSATFASRDGAAGAFGPAGSRYSGRTKEEVRNEMNEYWSRKGRLPTNDDLYIN